MFDTGDCTNGIQLASGLTKPETWTDANKTPTQYQAITTDFIQLNNQGVNQEKQLIQSAKLETPVVGLNYNNGVVVNDKPWKELDQLHQSPSDDEKLLFTDREALYLSSCVLEKEKYFDEILVMLLPEPVMQVGGMVSVVEHAMWRLGLEMEECGGGLELRLEWDPIAESVSIMQQCITENRKSLPRPHTTNRTLLEHFTKYHIHG